MWPHYISLAVSYIAFIVAIILLLRAVKKCKTTTSAQDDKPVKTEHLHSGQTNETLTRLVYRHPNVARQSGKTAELQRRRSVSGFYSDS